MANLFCSRPFEWLEVQGGCAFFCCPGWSRIPGVSLKGRNVAEIWNSPAAQEFRSSILDGTFKYCSPHHCIFLAQRAMPHWELNGSPVCSRDSVMDPRLHTIIRENKTILEDGPFSLNCGHDRTCNLSCPSCRKHIYVSSAQEQKKLIALQQRILGEIGQGLRQLYVAGNGDPFASPVYMALLNSLTPEKYPRLRIHLMTNAQLWTPERWRALEHMNTMVTTANISVDAASSRIYACNRRGGSWERLKRNLRFISRLRAGGKLRFVTLSFVVQSNNYRQMPEFVEFAREHGFDQVWFQKFRDWGILDVKDVQELRQYAVHQPRHRDFSRFLSVLADLRLNDPIVAMYSLYPLRESALIVTKIPAGRTLYKIKRLLWN